MFAQRARLEGELEGNLKRRVSRVCGLILRRGRVSSCPCLESHLGRGWALVTGKGTGLGKGRGWRTSRQLEARATHAEGQLLLLLKVDVVLQLLLLLLAQGQERDSLW